MSTLFRSVVVSTHCIVHGGCGCPDDAVDPVGRAEPVGNAEPVDCEPGAQAPSAAPAAAAPAAARPPIQTTKVEGTDSVYIFRNGNHQAMFVVTAEGVIATDPVAYGKPTGGQQYVDEIRKVTDKPISYLIYSHHHFDHIAGGKAFKDAGATVVAHRRAKERLAPLQDPHTVLPDEDVGDERQNDHARRHDARAELPRASTIPTRLW